MRAFGRRVDVAILQSVFSNRLPVRRSLKNALYKLPWPITKFFLYYIYRPIDLIANAAGRDPSSRPPYSLVKFGNYCEGEQAKIFAAFADYLVTNGLLKRDSTVLDMGCGVGSLASRILGILNGRGEYIGIDIIGESIQWCQAHIPDRYPKARFQHADIYNRSYNPRGVTPASEYRFPFDGDTFDLVVLKSVFTHMVPKDVNNYVSEIGRILKPKGICVATFFILNEESRACIESGRTQLEFRYPFGSCLAINPEIPEDAIAYDAEDVRAMYEEQSMQIDRIDTGTWCQRKSYAQSITGQDIVISQKAGRVGA